MPQRFHHPYRRPPSINIVQMLYVSASVTVRVQSSFMWGILFPVASTPPIHVLLTDKKIIVTSFMKTGNHVKVTFDQVEVDVTDSS